jgi:N utilization substance protein A
MDVRLDDEARQHIAVFEAETEAAAIDCLVDEDYDQVVFVVPPEQMGQAIGTDGEHVRALEERFGRAVHLVEAAETPALFVAAALAPAAVTNVTLEDDDEPMAYAEVPEADRGVAIGKDGRRIETARRLARRHFDIDGIELV